MERHKVQTERIDANTECPKCGRTSIRYSEVQQRSADEGSTIIYNCDCGERHEELRILVLVFGQPLTRDDSQVDYEQLSAMATIRNSLRTQILAVYDGRSCWLGTI